MPTKFDRAHPLLSDAKVRAAIDMGDATLEFSGLLLSVETTYPEGRPWDGTVEVRARIKVTSPITKSETSWSKPARGTRKKRRASK